MIIYVVEKRYHEHRTVNIMSVHRSYGSADWHSLEYKKNDKKHRVEDYFCYDIKKYETQDHRYTLEANKQRERLVRLLKNSVRWWNYACMHIGGCPDLRDADLWGSDLRGANLSGADLRGANLSGADLRGANLRFADLCDIGLREANLWNADLYGACLWRADLRGANLRSANLQCAKLNNADLRDANLSCAKLHNANLRFSDLRGANLEGIIFEYA